VSESHADASNPTWVLRLDVVRWGLDQLASRAAHPFFLAYLHLRSRSIAQGDDSNIRPRWSELAPYIEVPGGPPRKPYYRPLFEPAGNPSRYWLNENLAGSFAPSSLREGQPPMEVVRKGPQGTFSLRPDHASLALHHLLHDQPVQIYPFVAFLYRDYGIANSKEPDADSLVEIFQQDWRFTDEVHDNVAIAGGIDFSVLFDKSVVWPDKSWFEVL
jgi:hypothetical protein